MHETNSFVTLTYDEKNYEQSLNYQHFQNFMKYARKALGPTRFFMCGEYGEQTGRPHFHAILFGQTFTDHKQIGKNLYRSHRLEQLWTHGFSTFGAVTFASAAYVAGYAMKKRTGPAADQHYTRINPFTGEIAKVTPEFGHMSLKPGIGYTWFQKYWAEVYKPRDGIVMPGGLTMSAPRYYDKLLNEINENLTEDKKYDRWINGLKHIEESTPERLATQEQVLKAKLKQRRKIL